MAVARYNTNGSLDNSFGDSGKVKIKFDYPSQANGVAIQQNGKIVTAGWVYGNFALGRLNSNGSLDSSFGTNGKTVTDIGTTADQALSVGLQSDGSIIAGGQEITLDYTYNTVLAKYYGDPVKQLDPLAKKIRRWIRHHILNWQDDNDNNVSYYSIQQSSNGKNGFKEIGRVKAGAGSIYSYNLSSASSNSQTNSYRITAVGNNGSNAVSDVISDESFSAITISPNPAKDVVKVSGLSSTQKTTITIVNRNGNVMQSAISNASTYSMNITQLKSGLYTVQAISNGKTQTVKFVKE